MAVPLTHPDPPKRWWSTPDARAVLLLWAILTFLLVIFALTVPRALMGPQASTTMGAVENTFVLFSVAAAPVAAVVFAVSIHSLLRWRRKGDWAEGDPDGVPLRGNTWFTASWMLLSSLLCLFLLVWGFAALAAIGAPATAANPLVVNVTGQQWVWTFKYPQGGGVESDQLYLPINRPVVFKVTSNDVIHSFWVVEMGIKVDANPGVTTTTQTVPDRLGVYHVKCAELCGLLHADMETNVHVVTGQQFQSWLKSQPGGSG